MTIRRNVETMMVFGAPQLQVVDYIDSVGMLVSRIEQLVNAPTRPAAEIKNFQSF